MRFFIMLLPWLELATLIQLGIETSALTALFYVFLTFVAGIAILRYQGVEMFTRLRETQEGRIFGQQLVLIGPLRRRLVHWFGGPQPEPYVPERDRSEHIVIEGNFTEVEKRDNV